MQTLHTLSDLKHFIHTCKREHKSIAFVPTMGNLHAGHLSLVSEANKTADVVVVSIFVNPLQFGPNEDFDQYPRTLDADIAQLAPYEVDIVFAPQANEIYAPHRQTAITNRGLSNILCGQYREGHFDGVCTIVLKLFNLVEPDYAIFGLKDYQQFKVIEAMINDLNINVSLKGIPTYRENDGLAMSSRNQYLSPADRALAPKLYETLKATAKTLSAFNIERCITDIHTLETQAHQNLTQQGFTAQYVNILDADTLLPPSKTSNKLIILVAAYLNNTRLIDNIVITLT